ncbi:MAG TPA: hypothetical protein VGU25_09380 [Acidobacteriaceae bacterium]|nr:hypothetical protein [Acidobacteriaceae bacterium]
MYVPSRRTMIVAAICFVLLSTAFAQAAVEDNPNALRHLKGRTIVSEKFPKVQLTIGRGFLFVGKQQVNLHGNAEAEQYVFARRDRENIAKQFFLIQFEHFLPTNNFTYDYASMPTTQIGNLPVNYDVKSLHDLGALMLGDKGSDGAAMVELLAKRHISLPHNTAMVRMFHVPSADRRTELMIIYGEALPQNFAVPVEKRGDSLDKESSSSAQMFLQHARQALVVQAR